MTLIKSAVLAIVVLAACSQSLHAGPTTYNCRDIYYSYLKLHRGYAAFASSDGLKGENRGGKKVVCAWHHEYGLGAAKELAVALCNTVARRRHLAATCRVVATH